MKREKVCKDLSLLVVLVVCGLLINNWFLGLNTMRLPDLCQGSLSMLCNNMRIREMVLSLIIRRKY